MKEDNAKIKRVLAADIKFLKDHGIMDYSLLISAERYSANTVIQDNGGVIDQETPKNATAINDEESDNRFVNQFPSGVRKLSRHKSFFERTQSGTFNSKEALNEYLRSNGVTEGQFNRHMFLSSCGQWVYHVSIIDYLQQWNFDKKSEAFAKKWFLGKNAKGISAVPPEYYA